MSRSLFRSGVIVSFMTFVSRIFGLIRDVVIADKIGAAAGADIFFFANRIPNFLRRLFAEGAFAQAFVPVLTEVREKHGDNEVRLLLAKVSGTLGIIVSAVTLLGVVGSPIIAAIFGFGWFTDWVNDGPNAEKFVLASMMLKITFPYLWFITFVALSGAILNTYNRFAVAAFTPVFMNIAIIAAAIGLTEQFDVSAYALAIGVFLGGLIQFLFQLPFLYKAKFLVKPKWGWKDPYVTKIRTLMLPALFGVSVNQINLLLDTIIASFLITGSISWLYFADRLIEFPLGIFGIGIATVVLPRLSALKTHGETKAYSQTIDWGLRVIWLLGFPAMLGLICLTQPIISVLYFRGEFTVYDATQTGLALQAYACGLVSFMSIKVLAPGFYAQQDTKTPVRIGIKAMLANMLFNLALAPFLGFVGLALATALSGSLNAILLYRELVKRQAYHMSRDTVLFVIRLVLAGVFMAFVLLQFSPETSIWLDMPFWERIIWLAGLISLGVCSYLIAWLLIGGRIAHVKNGSFSS